MTFDKFFGHDIDFAKSQQMFSVHHLILVLFALLSIFATLKFAVKIKARSKEKNIRYFVIGLLIFLEVAYHIHNWTFPRFSVPLHICSFALLMNIVLLYTNSKKVFNYAFMFGVLGGAMAMFVPNSLGYTYFNFRYYHFIIAHFLIIAVPIYYYKAYNYRINYRTTLRVFRTAVLMGLVIYILNGFFGTNYWFIKEVPENVQSFFPTWNIYIISFVSVVFLTMNILWFISNFKTIIKKRLA